jgi:anthranilate phosphoribosyltransferase
MKSPDQIAFIQLSGEPYQQTIEQDGVRIDVDCNTSLDRLAANNDYVASLPEKIEAAAGDMATLTEGEGYYDIDRKLKHGQDLTFEDAFSVGTFVASGLNRPLAEAMDGMINNAGPHETHTLQGVALFAGVSTKEAYAHLTGDEIAGLAAATVHLDTVERTAHSDSILAFGGMGGDKGYPLENSHGEQPSKLFSLSTLSAVALAVKGPVHKHHSYPNTSKVAGQSAIEAYGARSDIHSSEDFAAVLEETDLVMSSCHNTRTLHTLSHRLRGETVNHVIGPLAFTTAAKTSVHGFIGVNEKVHPGTIIDALDTLDRKGYQAYDNSAVYCGTDLDKAMPEMFDQKAYYGSPEAKDHVRLDEIAPPPYASLVALSIRGRAAGTFEVRPEDFYTPGELARIDMNDLLIPNTKEAILYYNNEAISGRDEAKARYLAMTIGLGTFVRDHLERPDAIDPAAHRLNAAYLREATAEGLEVLMSGQAVAKLEQYVEATKRHAGR